MKTHSIHSIPLAKAPGINLIQRHPILLLTVSISIPLSGMAQNSFKWTGPNPDSLAQATQKFPGGPAQWRSLGGREILVVEHRFENYWARSAYSKPDGLWWKNNDDQKMPPAHPNNEVLQDVVAKKGSITVTGPGFLAAYKHSSGHNEGRFGDHGIILRDMEKPDEPWPFGLCNLGWSVLDGSTKKWRCDGASPVLPKLNQGGQIPEGKTMTFQIMAQSIPQNIIYSRLAYVAPKFARMSIWWFPRKGGKVVKVVGANGKAITTNNDPPGQPPANVTGGGTSIAPVADAQVYAYNYRNWNKANWGAYNILGAGPNAIGGEKRFFIKFDVARLNIPAGKRVKLRLFHYHSAGDSNYPLGIFRVTSPWKEGRGTYHSGTTEAPAGPGEISWVQQPATSPNAEAQFSPGAQANKAITVDVTNLVKGWKSGQANNGLMVAGLQPSRGTSVYGFYSREHADAAKRPALVIDSPSGADAPPPPPPAAEALQVRADHKQVQKGDTFHLPIWLDFPQTFSRARDGRINAANLNVEISYDPNVLKAATKIMPGNVLGGALFQSNPGQPGVIKLGFATQKGIQNSGTLAQLGFQAVGQPGQRSPITVRITTANDDQGRTPPTKAVHGYVEIVKEGVTGDINGNGAVDAGDALAALKMSVGLTPQNMILNVDKKDEVTSNDARLLLQMAVQGGTITTPMPRVRTPPPMRPAADTPAVTSAHTADARRAYQGYIAAYNKMTSLTAKGQADSPAGKSAYAAYQKAKDKYEAALKTQSPVSGVE